MVQFGFVANPSHSSRHNSSTVLANTPTWYYFSRPSHLAFHDFTKKVKPQKNLRSLLGLGLKFIPTPTLTNSWTRLRTQTYHRLFRSVHLRFHFAGKPPDEDSTTYDPKMYVHSKWTPPHWTIPPVALDERLSRFSKEMGTLFKTRKGKTNLLPHQQRALDTLQQQNIFLIVPCDKNLGPTIIERHDYLKSAMRDHLLDTKTYKLLNPSEIERFAGTIKKSILGWLKTHHKILTKMERAFIREKLDSNKAPYARFYMTLKAHKLKQGQNVDHLKSRLIVSCPGSLLHGLGIWVDRKLQDVAKTTISYFKNSLELKEQLTQLNLPPNARLFSADAVSMYTNIPTHTALNLIGKHITQYQRSSNGAYPVDAIRDALRLVMTMNIFTFGDLTLKQLNGTAMGTPPAPPYATIYYGIHEEKFLKKYSHRVIYYRRFIDDVIGIWSPNPNTQTDDIEWNSFQDTMNTFPGLTWEFSERAKTVDFMDMTISITNANKIEITLFEKKMNLHLYIPPHSAHPPGLLPGIVYSTLFRIFTICSSEEDKAKRTKTFFKRLIARGYKGNKIRNLFHKAINCARSYTGPSTVENTNHDDVILHLPFHPNDPASFRIQEAWRKHVSHPQWKMPLERMKNPKTKEKCNIKRMIIAYKRPMNLGNLLSHRDLSTGPPVSSYYYD